MLLIALSAPAARSAPVPTGTLRFNLSESGSPEPLPCRVHLRDERGAPVRADGLPFWRDHFVCEGRVELPLPAGDYSFEIERGPEYHSITGQVRVAAGATATVRREIPRLIDVSEEGWWSGDLHVHRPMADIELLMRAEDLHIAPVITWWNGRGPWSSNPPPAEPVVRFDQDRFHFALAGEDERGGGALLYFGLHAPLPLDGAAREFPPSAHFLSMAKSAPPPPPGEGLVWADIEKPFWWDTPIWLASGLADSVGIAHNHMHRSGVLENEAWGRARDRARFPSPQGNGRYTQELYYHILNSGIRLPPSAGSASGVLPNPVGYNRAYVHLEGELTWAKWWEGLRAGRVFVSNGPLLRVRADNHWPGHVFRSDGPLTINLETRVDSRDAVAALELVRDGRIEPLPSGGNTAITFSTSGWFLVRATAEPAHTFRFASTGPWYVEIGDNPRPVRRASAEFFLEWTRQRRDAVAAALTNETRRAAAMTVLDSAEQFWRSRLREAEDSLR
jgi:hypothetical protein